MQYFQNTFILLGALNVKARFKHRNIVANYWALSVVHYTVELPGG